MIDIKSLIATLTSTTVLMVILGFIAKSIIEQLLSREISSYKANLDMEKEKFVSEIQKSAFENQYRFQKLFTTQAETIAELYEKLVQATEDAESLTSIVQFSHEPSLAEKAKKAFKSSNELHLFFEKKRIYFTADLCDKISEFSLELRKNINLFALNIQSGTGNPGWQEVWDKMSEEIPQLKKDLENYFREILGM